MWNISAAPYMLKMCSLVRKQYHATWRTSYYLSKAQSQRFVHLSAYLLHASFFQDLTPHPPLDDHSLALGAVEGELAPASHDVLRALWPHCTDQKPFSTFALGSKITF